MVKSIKGKISKYLLELQRRSGICTFMLPLKRGELADFLNVSRPTLSREFCKLRDEGIIDSIKIRCV
ncbi:MAG: winged helix-turn-helix domain-containing protein [Chloroflexi bacterium]|uniref:Winged helix-turn-helix domain-containing protein n=1 Tax=Candidatus Chlorohelix allophototropha TaxID=3003348 RepID=A0A8T7M3Y9_9CHLR|nr:winged helix-turn-helix domain-containing protein [Chloroflexota bacterium]